MPRSSITHTLKSFSINQIESVYKHAEEIISSLDEYAIKELFSGDEKDVDKILGTIIEETKNALFFGDGPIKSHSFGYLDKLTSSLDEALKIKSFNYFVTTVLPTFEMAVHHIEWGNLIQFYQKLGVIAARDHSKSFTFSFAYPIWKLYRYRREGFGIGIQENNLNKRGMIITNEHSLAKDFLKLISEEIQENPILKDKLYSKDTWGREEITTKFGAELKVKGAGSALRGRHPGWIVVDDFLDDSALYSQTQREKSINLFHSVIMNMIVPKGQVIVVGTPYHESDLYANLGNAKGWRVFYYPAILPDGSLLWDRYTFQEILDKKEAQGNVIFSRELLVKPITNESSIFPWSILETSFIGMDNVTLVENIYSSAKKFKKVALGCDFAISSSIGADYTCYTSWGVDELDNYWLLNIWYEKNVSYNQQIAKMKELNRNFKYNVIMCEDNAFQKVMLDIAKDAGLNVVPHTTGVNKYDLKTGMPGLAIIFEQGRIKLPRGDAHSKNMTDLLCSQLNSITWAEDKIQSTSEHDDAAYSCWIGIKGCSYVSGSFNVSWL